MTNKRIAISSAGAKATHIIERWKRGVMLLLALAVCAIGSAVVVGIPMTIIGEALNYPPLQSLSNIAPVAFLLALPWIITSDGVAHAIRKMLDTGSR